MTPSYVGQPDCEEREGACRAWQDIALLLGGKSQYRDLVCRLKHTHTEEIKLIWVSLLSLHVLRCSWCFTPLCINGTTGECTFSFLFCYLTCQWVTFAHCTGQPLMASLDCDYIINHTGVKANTHLRRANKNVPCEYLYFCESLSSSRKQDIYSPILLWCSLEKSLILVAVATKTSCSLLLTLWIIYIQN